MTTTTHLGLYKVPENTIQQPGVPVNASLEALDAAIGGAVAVEFASDANITLTRAQWMTSVLVLTDSPTTLTTGRDVVFPAAFPSMLVVNSTAQTIALKKAGQAGVALAAGESVRINAGPTDVIAATVGGGGGGGSTIGKHAIPIMAGAIAPSVTGGCAALASIASAANQPDIVTLDFDPSTEEYAQFAIPMPKSWNEGTITAQFRWSHAATTVNFAVIWGLQAVAVSNDDPIAVAFGTAQEVTDIGGTTNDLYITDETAAITVAGTPQAGDTVFFRVYRKAAAGGDTLAIDARLHSVVIFITTDAENDA